MIAPSQKKKTPKDSRAVLQSSLSKLLTSQYSDCLCLPPLSLSTSPNSLFGLLLSFLSPTPNLPPLPSSYIFCLGSVSLNIKACHHGSQGSWDPQGSGKVITRSVFQMWLLHTNIWSESGSAIRISGCEHLSNISKYFQSQQLRGSHS